MLIKELIFTYRLFSLLELGYGNKLRKRFIIQKFYGLYGKTDSLMFY